MARQLKVFQTHIGFYEMIVAVPSMKAAAEAWGVKPNIFAHGFAAETRDPKAVKAALAEPGAVLKRPYGQSGDFKLEPETPSAPKLTARQKKAAAEARQARRRKTEEDRALRAAQERKAKAVAREELARLEREEQALRQRRQKLQKQLRRE
jgi:hypothetical protein